MGGALRCLWQLHLVVWVPVVIIIQQMTWELAARPELNQQVFQLPPLRLPCRGSTSQCHILATWCGNHSMMLDLLEMDPVPCLFHEILGTGLNLDTDPGPCSPHGVVHIYSLGAGPPLHLESLFHPQRRSLCLPWIPGSHLGQSCK